MRKSENGRSFDDISIGTYNVVELNDFHHLNFLSYNRTVLRNTYTLLYVIRVGYGYMRYRCSDSWRRLLVEVYGKRCVKSVYVWLAAFISIVQFIVFTISFRLWHFCCHSAICQPTTTTVHRLCHLFISNSHSVHWKTQSTLVHNAIEFNFG